MLAAIPVEEKKLDAKVSESFGRANYFLIFNNNSSDGIFLENTAKDSEGGAGLEAAQLLIDNEVDMVFLKSCGKNGAKVLKEADIAIYEIAYDNAIENFKAYNRNNLKTLTEFHEGYHGNGGK